MKFRLINIGPIKDAEIELGDFTLFLGLPSTGKSFALKTIFSSLIFLKGYEEIVSGKSFLPLPFHLTHIGIDYVISYLKRLLEEGYDVCDPKVIDSIIKVAKEYDVNVVKENDCLIKLSERVSPLEINNAISTIKEKIKSEAKQLLERSVGYSNSSAVYINGRRIEELIENLKVKNIELEVKKNGKFKFYSSGVEMEYELTSKEAEDLIVDITLKPKKSEKLQVQEESVYLLEEILPIKEIVKELIKEYYSFLGVYDTTFLPYYRVVIVNKNTMEFSSERIIPRALYLMTRQDPFIRDFKLHIHNAIKTNKNYILDVIKAITKMDIEVGKDDEIEFMQNGMKLDPFFASSMANEVTTILLPLADLQTPALVLIEEPEAHLHLAYQNLLLLVMLSLVQHSYKFLITTHGDLIAAFLGDLVRYKPSKEKILELLKKIFGQDFLNPTIEKIVEEAEKTVREGKIKVYYFENGTAKEFPARDLTYNVPGVTQQVIHSIVDWEFELKRNM